MNNIFLSLSKTITPSYFFEQSTINKQKSINDNISALAKSKLNVNALSGNLSTDFKNSFVFLGGALLLSGPQAFFHELGHLIPTKMFFPVSKCFLEIHPKGISWAGSVNCQKGSFTQLSFLGEVIGRDQALLIYAAGGPAVDLIGGLFFHYVAKKMDHKYPFLASALQGAAIINLLDLMLYAIQDITSCPNWDCTLGFGSLRGGDFSQISRTHLIPSSWVLGLTVLACTSVVAKILYQTNALHLFKSIFQYQMLLRALKAAKNEPEKLIEIFQEMQTMSPKWRFDVLRTLILQEQLELVEGFLKWSDHATEEQFELKAQCADVFMQTGTGDKNIEKQARHIHLAKQLYSECLDKSLHSLDHADLVRKIAECEKVLISTS